VGPACGCVCLDLAGQGLIRFHSKTMRTPVFLHLLTAIHAIGAVACFVMAGGSAASGAFREALAVSGGSAYMVNRFGEGTWAFLLFVGVVLAILAYASWRVRPWAWHLTLLVYGIGVIGSLWQVSIGIRQGWVAAAVNGAVVVYAATPGVRRAYRRSRPAPAC
jgi:hypothetical protein